MSILHNVLETCIHLFILPIFVKSTKNLSQSCDIFLPLLPPQGPTGYPTRASSPLLGLWLPLWILSQMTSTPLLWMWQILYHLPKSQLPTAPSTTHFLSSSMRINWSHNLYLSLMEFNRVIGLCLSPLLDHLMLETRSFFHFYVSLSLSQCLMHK